MDFYTFLRQDSDEVIRYTFYTDNDITYIAFFYKTLDFSPLFEGHEYLCNYGWVAGFNPIEEDIKIPVDHKVGKTISKVFEDFLSDKIPNAVIIYHCDQDKDQQHARNRKFNHWFSKISHMDLKLKVTEIDIVKGNEVETNFIGCIYSEKIQEDVVLDGLENFSQYLLLALRKD